MSRGSSYAPRGADHCSGGGDTPVELDDSDGRDPAGAISPRGASEPPPPPPPLQRPRPLVASTADVDVLPPPRSLANRAVACLYVVIALLALAAVWAAVVRNYNALAAPLVLATIAVAALFVFTETQIEFDRGNAIVAVATRRVAFKVCCTPAAKRFSATALCDVVAVPRTGRGARTGSRDMADAPTDTDAAAGTEVVGYTICAGLVGYAGGNIELEVVPSGATGARDEAVALWVSYLAWFAAAGGNSHSSARATVASVADIV